MNIPTTMKPTTTTGSAAPAKGACSATKKPGRKLSLEITEVEEVLERKISP